MLANDQIMQGASIAVRGAKSHPNEVWAQDAGADLRHNMDRESHGQCYFGCNKLPGCVLVKFGFEEDFVFGESRSRCVGQPRNSRRTAR
eukprot:1017758-Pyramimonas_sp.AAC.1